MLTLGSPSLFFIWSLLMVEYIPMIIGSIQQHQRTKTLFYRISKYIWVLVLVDLLYALFEVIVKVFFNVNLNFILNPWFHLSLLCIFKLIYFLWKFIWNIEIECQIIFIVLKLVKSCQYLSHHHPFCNINEKHFILNIKMNL
jgi:hypothetical protein